MTPGAPLVLMTDWVNALPPAALVSRALDQGYDGIEAWWPAEPESQRELSAAVADTGAALSLLAERMLESRSRTGLDVLLELHRSRMLYSAHASQRILERHPDLRVTFDVSHWLVVAESMLADQRPAVDLAIERADHIHARIGHPQGPQVNDPEAEEWTAVVDQHLRWWDDIVGRLRSEGRAVTFLAEFGPVDYAPSTPGTRLPLRDPESSNLWMMRLLRERYGA